MKLCYGDYYRISIYGSSHGPCVGVEITGLPIGFRPDMEKLLAFLQRRAPGGTLVSARTEPDIPVFCAGMTDGAVSADPVVVEIANTDARPAEYRAFAGIPRPGHADYTAAVKYGLENVETGGGVFSGRMTAPLCAAGGLALQLLAQRGISVGARLLSVGAENDPAYFEEAIRSAADAGDSLGGVIACTADGLPAGLGGAMFSGLESRISACVFGIPGVKGIEFGSGFAGSCLKGSENNDAFFLENGRVVTKTNNHGGILGGISSGMPLVFRVAMKPTPSIAKLQQSVDLRTMEETTISVHGRHDPCIALRAVPCVEAAAACVLYDAILEEEASK